MLSSQTFDAFGQRKSTDNNADPFAGFGGQQGYYTDWATGLALLTFRYYEAMTSDRPYRKGLSQEIAFAEIANKSGTY